MIAGRAQIEIRKGEVVMAYDHGAFRVRNLEDAVRFYCDKLGF